MPNWAPAHCVHAEVIGQCKQPVRAFDADLGETLREGMLEAPIDSTYSIEQVKQALVHAPRGTSAQELVLPSGHSGNVGEPAMPPKSLLIDASRSCDDRQRGGNRVYRTEGAVRRT